MNRVSYLESQLGARLMALVAHGVKREDIRAALSDVRAEMASVVSARDAASSFVTVLRNQGNSQMESFRYDRATLSA